MTANETPNTAATPDATAPEETITHLTVGAASFASRTEPVGDAQYGVTLGQGIGIAIEKSMDAPVFYRNDYVVADPKQQGRFNPDLGALRAVLFALQTIPADKRATTDLTLMVDRSKALSELDGFSNTYRSILDPIRALVAQYSAVRFRYATKYRSPVVRVASDAAEAAIADDAVLGASSLDAEQYAELRADMRTSDSATTTAPAADPVLQAMFS